MVAPLLKAAGVVNVTVKLWDVPVVPSVTVVGVTAAPVTAPVGVPMV
jgi:hypothetical protein